MNSDDSDEEVAAPKRKKAVRVSIDSISDEFKLDPDSYGENGSIGAVSETDFVSVEEVPKKTKGRAKNAATGSRKPASNKAARSSSYDSSNILGVPLDWNDESKYNPKFIEIWAAWLAFVRVFNGKETVNGTQPHLVHPELPWDEQGKDDIPNVLLLMHYMPTELTNAFSINQHPASAMRSDGTLKSTCWELVRQSVGVSAYAKYCIKLNYSPSPGATPPSS